MGGVEVQGTIPSLLNYLPLTDLWRKGFVSFGCTATNDPTSLPWILPTHKRRSIFETQKLESESTILSCNISGLPVWSMVRNEVSFHYKRLYVVQSLPGRICSRLGSIVSSVPEFTQVLLGPRKSYILYSSTDYYPSEFKPSILNYVLRGKNRLIWDSNSPSLPFFLLLASNILLRDFHSVEYFQNSLL